VQLAHERRVHGRGGEVELADRLHYRELGLAQAVGRGPALHVGQLRGEQLAHDPLGRVVALGGQRHDLVVGGAHAAQLELDHQLEDGGALHHAPTGARSPS
jgi:hypothetical protein